MKKVLTGLVLLLMVSACSTKFIENEDEKHFAQNKEDIEAYIAANNLILTEHTDSGIFWSIEEEKPDAPKATVDHTVHIAYTMKSLSGANLITVTPEDSVFFDTGLAANIFEGFIIAANTLREGEKGIFYLPSPLAYGGNPPTSLAIKAWEVLVLEIESIKHYTEGDLIERYLTGKGITDPEITSLGVYIIRTENRPPTGDLIAGDGVTVAYKGYFLNGTVFDEGSFDYVLGTNTVIPGFANGIENMRVGEQASIIIPWRQAYGEQGSSSGSIAGRTTLAFDLEIVSKN